MGKPSQTQVSQAAQLLALSGRYYVVRQGRYLYVRLNYHSKYIEEIQLLLKLGGVMQNHLGERNLWQVHTREEFETVLMKVLPYLPECQFRTLSHQVLQWALEPSRHKRLGLAQSLEQTLRQLRFQSKS